MLRSVLSVAAAVGISLALAGCGGGGTGGSGGGHPSSSLSSGDKGACDTLDQASTPDPDPVALEQAFGLDGTSNAGMSAKLKPYALLVGGSAQLVNSGADDGKLGEYVGQMRGVCETLGWRASS